MGKVRYHKLTLTMTSTIASIATLLQLATSLLMGARANPSMPLAAQQQIVAAASQTVQLSTQALAFAQGWVTFPVPQNASRWPTAAELQVAPYLDARGGYAQLGALGSGGASVRLDASTISFGDLNGDGYDDAMVVVQRTKFDGSTSLDLAAMLNQGGILFNIADTPLGNNPLISHQIQNGEFVVNSSSHYMLLGNQLIKTQ